MASFLSSLSNIFGNIGKSPSFQTLAGPAIGAGLSLFGGVKDPSNGMMQQASAEQSAANAARGQLYSYNQGVMAGGPQLQSAVAPQVNALNREFDAAQLNALNRSAARGGGLERSQRDVDTARRSAIGNLYGNATINAQNQLSTLSGTDAARAASTMASVNAANLQRQQQRTAAISSLGGVLTRLLSGMGGTARKAPARFPGLPTPGGGGYGLPPSSPMTLPGQLPTAVAPPDFSSLLNLN